jgi:hypothetical protein
MGLHAQIFNRKGRFVNRISFILYFLIYIAYYYMTKIKAAPTELDTVFFTPIYKQCAPTEL